ncbi:peptide chain release factor N(5)-glutamine methyltransferase [Limoniibacter endophyticus]|uniref:Release factor glutamine methyltransferase n=1 Tax=Limoniibacter endophyticus TaxID=1565040 RepID=A0A8J3DQ79_9HYPH|nr:peptide chain release factor N(5)-glutamine methyltransferase [Limoniibacter endophyticus]GHC76108.1 release factor glutamine methyltransferase [Limoniibacter endophyticus]
MGELPKTAASLRAHVEAILRDREIAEAAMEARLLLENFAGLSRLSLIAYADAEVGEEKLAALELALKRRLAGEPVHRIIGHRQFYGLDLALSKETLEPRPDTEILVDRVLAYLEKLVESQKPCTVLDIGTGTGAICLAILSQFPVASGVGVDISQDALATAARNSRLLGLEKRFTALHSDCFEMVEGRFDAIVSNPPYIPSADIEGLQPEVRDFDPLQALDGGIDGLVFYRKIAEQSAHYLKPGGIVAVEIGFDQRDSVTAIFTEHGWECLEAAQDLSGHERVLIFMQS